MVTKRIRSEYMKKFKDPKWETYTKCYEEMLKYRLTRRLLEYTHRPWFWSGSDSDSDSGDRSPPPCQNQVGIESSREAEKEECEEVRRTRPEEQQTRSTAPPPRIPIQDNEEEDAPQSVHASQHDSIRETRLLQVEEEEQKAKENKQLTAAPRDPEKVREFMQPQLRKSSKSTKRGQKVRPAPPRQPGKDAKESRHPFALYGSGERRADMAGRRTHNVRPAASTTEIHESALRARTRREVERQMQIQRSEKRRAKSADVEKARRRVEPEFNPWLSEYMRCFSARSR